MRSFEVLIDYFTGDKSESPAKGTDKKVAADGEEVAAAPAVVEPPRPETAWERGLRQAKEMRKKSQQRKETDMEYEEKRTNMSLTQVRNSGVLHTLNQAFFGRFSGKWRVVDLPEI